MTAEVAILNPNAVALAADSMVTITSPTGQKTYNSVNKLFALSKCHPVGVMIFGNGSIMGIPWEVVIKRFRAQIGDRAFDTLSDYWTEFRNSLPEMTDIFPPTLRQMELRNHLMGYALAFIREPVDDVIAERFKEDPELDEAELEEVVTTVIDDHLSGLSAEEDLESLSQDDVDELLTPQLIEEVRSTVLEKLPLSSESADSFDMILRFSLSKNRFSSDTSGVVVAGYGEDEFLPSLTSVQIDSIYGDRVRHGNPMEVAVRAGENAASIVPFAQREVVDTLLTGIDPEFVDAAESVVTAVLTEGVNGIAEEVQLDEKRKTALVNQMRKVAKDFRSGLDTYMRDHHVQPLLSAVEFLPKDELAMLAEALINVTSLKRKVSMDLETVGGPIDVALISKGEGLIWIRRKHYFDPTLNPQYFSNYYRR